MPYPIITPVGEDGLLVEYEPRIDPAVNRKVRRLAAALEQNAFAELGEIVPAYRSLMVYFDPSRTGLDQARAGIEAAARNLRRIHLPPPRVFVVPTVYGGEHAPDLERIAAATGLPAEEVIRLFSTPQYPVYCLGFLCGLAYLGGVPEPLRLPRLTTPRPRVPAGSVGLAGAQAVVLPIDQPSGWHYLGRTWVTMYDPGRLPPTPLCPGDLVQCPAVPEAEARRWAGRWLGDCLA